MVIQTNQNILLYHLYLILIQPDFNAFIINIPSSFGNLSLEATFVSTFNFFTILYKSDVDNGLPNCAQ